MSQQDRYVPINQIPAAEKLVVSEIIPNKSKIRIGAFLFEAQSANNKNQTVTFVLAGFFPPEQPVNLEGN